MSSMALLLALLMQTKVTDTSGPRRPAPAALAPTVAVAMAVRAPRPPVIDGKDDDEIWRTAPPITELRQWRPGEDLPPRYRTEARVAYDDHNLYVFVRAFDPHPDSILKLMARRDTWTAADKFWVMIDSYHDRRSGYEFGVNPAGVKFDMAISNDGNEDDAWDAVWDVATTVDSLGWTAEYKIPLSQLRYPPGAHVFGFSVWRDLQRYQERESWPVLRQSRPGFVSQFGELRGLEGLPSPRRLEVTPYVVAKDAAQASTTGTGYGMNQTATGGADVKFGITSNLTLDATVNPDFGQVEADPSVLNLTAFETYFSERRPFFVEGAGLFRFDVNCSAVNCNNEGLFYSRRIGREPELDGLYGDASTPTSSRILGATKLTGHLPGGLSIATVDAVTQRTVGTQSRTIEPLTNYMVTRLQQDFHRGESGFGAVLTAVNRDLDQWSAPYLHRNAYVGAVDFRHRFLGSRYQVGGSIDFSRVAGTDSAIALTQRSPVHYLQRPDGGQTYDPSRTSLSGHSEEFSLGKVGGGITRWETDLQSHSAGFEVNDLGFMQRTDQTTWATWFQVRTRKPGKVLKQGMLNNNWWQTWTTAGLPTERAYNFNTHSMLWNNWWVHAGATIGQLGATYCDFDCSRGGPAVRQDAYFSPWFGVEGDGRKIVVPNLFFNFSRSSGGRSHSLNTNGNVNLRISSRFTPSLGFSVTQRTNDNQTVGALQFNGATHYVFGHLVQSQASLSVRFDYTLTRTLSLQVYANPFVSKGTYTNPRELSATPRAADYNARYQPYADTTYNPGGFNFKAFNSNVVLRWEYRPGSTLFAVWQQGRSDFLTAEGTRPLTGDLRDILALPPRNTFLLKASYWLSR